MLDVIVILALVLVAVAALPIWPYSRGWSRTPSGVALGLLAVFAVVWFIVPVIA